MAVAEELTLYAIDPGENAPAVAYSYCSDEDSSWVECVSHDLSCVEGELELLISGSEEGGGTNVRQIIGKLIEKPAAIASVTFSFADGKQSLDLQVAAFDVARSDLSDDWDVTLKFYDDKPLREALTPATVSGAKAAIGDQAFSLNPNKKAEQLLLKLMQTCGDPG